MKTTKLTTTIGLIIFIIIFGLGCENKKTTETNNTESTKKDVITLKMAHNLPVNSALHEASVLFAKKVKEKTNNKVQIQIFPKQQLGNDYQMVELARSGEIDILLTPTAKMSVTVPSMQYADLPFLFPTRKDAYELLDGEPGQLILKDLEKVDLLGVSFWENGFKHFTGNEPFLSPESFKDKKIRVMKSRIIMEQFKALDAQPIPIDFHATKQALLDKVVDGQENPLVAIVNMEFHKVQSDLVISEHAYLPYVFSISKISLNNLSGDIQDLLINTALEVTTWEREETQKREKTFLDIIKKEGVSIHTLNKEQKEKFREKTKYIVKRYEDVIGSHIISKTEEILFNKYKTDDMVAIGIDATLSMGSTSSGLAIKRGVELAVDEINADGGLLGKKVVVIAKDHRTISTQGVKNIEEFSSNPNIVGIIGGKFSAIISSELEAIHNSKIPFISPWASADKIVNNGYEDNYVFRVSGNNTHAVKEIFNETMKHNKNPLVVVENSIWGRGALDLIEKFSFDRGLQIPNVVINRGEQNFSKVMETIKEKNIDSLLVVLNSAEGSRLVGSLNSNNIKLPIVSHWGIVGDDFYEKNKEYLQSVDLRFIQTFAFSNNMNEKANLLGESYLKKYAKQSFSDIFAPSGVVQAYDATNLLAMAIRSANSFDGPKVKKALENIKKCKGVIKTYNKPFSKDDHEALSSKDFFFAKYDKNGLIVSIKK
jgi:tripartite ATP-independent transporter DctP family solute receptor